METDHQSVELQITGQPCMSLELKGYKSVIQLIYCGVRLAMKPISRMYIKSHKKYILPLLNANWLNEHIKAETLNKK